MAGVAVLIDPDTASDAKQNSPMHISHESHADQVVIADLTKVAFDPMTISDSMDAERIDRLRGDGDPTLSLVVKDRASWWVILPSRLC